jgi:DNA-directed RNA polymerase subunit beta
MMKKRYLKEDIMEDLKEYLIGQKASSNIKSLLRMESLLTVDIIDNLSRNDLRLITIEDDKIQKNIEKLSKHFDGVIKTLEDRFNDKVDKLQRGDELLTRCDENG